MQLADRAVRTLKRPDVVFGLILIPSLWALFLLHFKFIGAYAATRQAMLDSLLDSMLLSLPFFFVPRKLRRIVLAIMPATALLFEVNALYFRNFNALPTLSALFNGNPLNHFAIVGAIDSLRWTDTLFLIPIAITAFAWQKLSAKRICDKSFPRGIIAGSLALWLIAPVMRFELTTRRLYHWGDIISFSSFKEFHAETFEIMCFTDDTLLACSDYGFLPYLHTAIKSVHTKTHELTDLEREQISEFLNTRGTRNPIYTNALAENDKNLILIIVESLNSAVINTDATPFLNELIDAEGTFAALNLREQVGVGRSADGQFMYNTGLLPLKSETLVFNYAAADYPSLAKALRRHTSLEIIAEDEKVWNHHLTTISYGYDRLISNVAPDGPDGDARVFDRAAQILDSLPQPFFMEITTISMHEPYTNRSVTNPPAPHPDQNTANYLAAATHCDDAIRKFVGSLKSYGIADNTIIAIAGDHCARPSALAPDLTSRTVPLIIANAGITCQLTDTANQIDVFPTLLDIMGIEQNYRGVGRSLLHNQSPDSTPEEAWLVSSLIIKSRQGIANLMKND